MTGNLDGPATARVLIKTEIPLWSVAVGRGTLVLDATIPADPNLLLPVAGNWGPLAPEFRSDHVAMNGMLLRRLSDRRSRTEDLQALQARGAPPGELVYGREFLKDDLAAVGAREEPRILVTSYGDADPRVHGGNLSILDMTRIGRYVSAFRAQAARRLLRRPDGIYRPAPESRIVLALDEPPILTVLDEPGSRPDHSLQFSIDRWNDAVAYMETLRPGAPTPAVAPIRIDDPGLLPPVKSDLVRVAGFYGPLIAKIRPLDPCFLEAGLVRCLHDVAQTETIIGNESEDGARRVLESAARLVDELEVVHPAYHQLDELRFLRSRAAYEATVAPGYRCTGPSP